jgi:hypothetical protein
MTRRSKLWLAAAAVFTAVNFFGGIFAVAQMEMMHAFTHLVLTIVGGVVLWRMLARAGDTQPLPIGLPAERVDQLQQSLDVIAVEVERVGEAQRYLAKLAAEREKPTQPKKD